MSDEPRIGGAAERTTINLTAKTSEDLASAIELGRKSKTDTINEAIQLYAALLRVQANGGSVYIRSQDGAELEKLWNYSVSYYLK